MFYLGGYGPEIIIARREPDGRLTTVGRVACAQASFLAAHPRLPRLYAVGEFGEGTLTTLGIAPDGTLAMISTLPTEGMNPCHVAVTDDSVAVANYESGSLAVFELDGDGVPSGRTLTQYSGKGPHPDRQQGPHAHMVVHDAGERYVVDLGTDSVHLRGGGSVRLRAGSGPRHMVSDGKGHWFVSGELDGTVTCYGDDWREIATVRASRTGENNDPSHIDLVDGLLYVANRGPDTISVFRPDGLEHVAEVPTGGRWPRHFAIDGDHLYVANQRSSEVSVFGVTDGVPRPLGLSLEVPRASCVLIRHI